MEDHFNEVCFPYIAPVPRDLHRVILTQDGHIVSCGREPPRPFSEPRPGGPYLLSVRPVP
jgi:hypothetical protein